MLSRASGLAIAGAPGDRPAYLVASSNGGSTWRVRSELPFTLGTDAFVLPTLDFLTAKLGYVESGVATNLDAQSTYVTVDGGRNWAPLQLGAGMHPASFDVNVTTQSTSQVFQAAGGVLTLVALHVKGTCAEGGVVCPSYLEQFRLGAATPFSTHLIPPLGSGSGPPLSDRLIAAVGARTAVVAEGDLEGAFPVLVTHDAGRHWTQWRTPCASHELSTQELHLYANEWIADCWQDQGMNQGTIVVTMSLNHGRTWHPLASGSQGGGQQGSVPEVGVISNVDQTLWKSNNGRFLWAWDSNRGWLSESSDGGRRWTLLGPVQNGNGAPVADLSPIGASGAILIVLGAALETTDGVHWHRVRLLAIS